MIFVYIIFTVYVFLMVQVDLMVYDDIYGGMSTVTILSIFIFITSNLTSRFYFTVHA